MNKPTWRRGVVLLQTLVITVILSMISVMVLKWVMGRYMMAARNYRSVTTRGRAHGYFQDRFATWNFNTTGMPGNSPANIGESFPAGFVQQVCVRSRGNTRFDITSDQDDPGAPCP
jgi:hypothetical protein